MPSQPAVPEGAGGRLFAGQAQMPSGEPSGDGIGVRVQSPYSPSANGKPPAAVHDGGRDDDPAVPCPDPNCCRFKKRYPSGPWTCDYNHPAVGGDA